MGRCRGLRHCDYSLFDNLMAHFAQLDSDGVVINVVVIANEEILDENGVENEQLGIDRCNEIFGSGLIWKQTSYNASFRKNYAGTGYRYDELLDAFIAPQPFPSWTLDADTCQWVAPKPPPNDGKPHAWNESLLRWM